MSGFFKSLVSSSDNKSKNQSNSNSNKYSDDNVYAIKSLGFFGFINPSSGKVYSSDRKPLGFFKNGKLN